ncbi:hypothetical protein AB0L00_24100 [Actinoallomurus sp. NPDC052308]|uniref:hypothetical protein n=1 Tax=Actinoallomurus sp. NPDC052308 TaxID=3155530 RepID=UPI0034170C92
MKLPMLLAMGNGELAAKAHTGFGLIGAFKEWVQGLPLWVLLPVGLLSLFVSVVMALLAWIVVEAGGERAWILILGALMSGGVAAFLLLSVSF